ncbi:MAG: translocation/assembly module TamB domain-containing protein [Bacteroidota bacterium]|nr:translocation/assembly module TamB domain-containing protein [Bacteroidota bacterium]
MQTSLTQKVAGYLSQKFHTTITVKGVSISFFNKLVLEEVLVMDQKNDSLLFVKELVASIDSFSMKKHYVAIDKLVLNQIFLHVGTDSSGTPNYKFLTDKFSLKDTLKSSGRNFGLILNKFEFNDSEITYDYRDSAGLNQVVLSNISLGISAVSFKDKKLALQITRFELNNQKDFRLEDFSADLIATTDSVCLNQLHIRTSNSEITGARVQIDKSMMGQGLDLKKLKVNIDLKKSLVSLKDIAQLVPSLKGMEENLLVSGQVSGKLADLKGKNIELSMGQNTTLSFDFYLNGLPEITNTYMHIDLKKSFTDLNDIQRVKFPDHFPLQMLDIPASLFQAGIIEYKGNFTGFLSDFVSYGTFRSKWGVLTTDLSFVPSEGEKLKINGRVKTVNFQLGQLLQSDLLDRITFNGDINGVLNPQTRDFKASVSGQIDSIMVNHYQYENIELSGDILNKRFDGSLIVDDPNLRFRFDGEFDLNVPVPVFNFNMQVEKADLKALKLVDNFKESEISFALNANFTGSNIDNLDGMIHFAKGSYQNENGLLSLENFDLKTFNENEPVLQIRSDFLDADIRGQYKLHNMHHSVKKIIASYLPSTGLKIPVQKNSNNFDFSFILKDINRFTQVLIPDLTMNPAKIEGRINSEKNTLVINGIFPLIQYKSTVFKKLTINVDGNSKLDVRNKVDEISVGEKLKVYNLSLISEASGDVLDSKLSWNNYGDVSYSGSVNTSARFFRQEESPHIEISVKPTRLFLADSLWQINSTLITLDSTRIKFNKLALTSRSQSVIVDGLVDKDQDNKLNIVFNQIDLNSLNTFMAGDLKLKGELNGSLSLFDVYRRTLFLSDLKIASLNLLGQSLGDATIQSRWDSEANELNAELVVESNQKRALHAFGIFNPGRDSLSIYANFDHFSLLILQPLMGSSFANFHGDATGKVHIFGSPGYIQHDGALFVANAGLMLSELRVNYNINDSVRFAGDKIIFPDIGIQDDFGNSGVFSGSIKHRSFSKMVYDMTIKSDRIMAINTTPSDNEQFYGKTFGSGVVRITGKGATVLIDGIARTEKGTEMNISLGYEEEAREYDFLSFISRSYQPKFEIVKAPVYESNVQMKFDIEITPEAKAQLIYNSKIGDIIRSQGSGNLQFAIDKDYNISIFGEYTVSQGDYLFTLQNVINKKFEIQQGGTIEWNGNPYDATLNFNAIYRLKASLTELFVNTTENADYNQRVPVLCKINLTNSLNNPDIRFDIELPTTEDHIRDVVRQYISTEEDMNKQMLSLLVLGKFYTPEYLRGTYSGANNSLVGSTASTASELFSNQFSNWLSQISNDFDIGFNYRPGNEITNNEIEFALSTQMFNDRVSINGNIANNSAQRTTTNNNSLVGDADVKVKLTNNGKLQLKAYNHSNNNLIYETSPYTQGVGISYREDFNDFNELWQKMIKIFKPQKTRDKRKN